MKKEEIIFTILNEIDDGLIDKIYLFLEKQNALYATPAQKREKIREYCIGNRSAQSKRLESILFDAGEKYVQLEMAYHQKKGKLMDDFYRSLKRFIECSNLK